MAGHEWRVFCELLRSKDMNPVIQLGLNESQFKGDLEAGMAFEFVRSHYFNPLTYREWPTMSSIRKRFPTFRMTAQSDAGQLNTLIREMQSSALGNDLRSVVNHFDTLVEDDPFDAIRLMQSQLARLSYNYRPTTGFGLTDIAEGMKQAHEEAKSGAAMGIPFPWECLTYDSMGKHNGDLIVFYGRMKSMKTWIMLFQAMYDFLKARRRVVIWSREMNEQKTKLRLAAILSGVDYQLLKHGDLPPHLFKAGYKAIRKMAELLERTPEEIEEDRKKDRADLLCLVGRRAPKTLEELGVAVEAFGAESVYIDSFYHLSTNNSVKMRSDHERQRAVTEDTKQAALDWDIPVTVTAQANREGEKTAGETLADVGRTDAIGQEGDLIARIIRRPGVDPHEDDYEGYWADEEKRNAERERRRATRTRIYVSPRHRNRVPAKAKKNNETRERPTRKSAEVAIILGGNRDGVLNGFLLSVIPGYRFEVVRDDFGPKEAKKWMKADDESPKNERGGDPGSAGIPTGQSYN